MHFVWPSQLSQTRQMGCFDGSRLLDQKASKQSAESAESAGFSVEAGGVIFAPYPEGDPREVAWGRSVCGATCCSTNDARPLGIRMSLHAFVWASHEKRTSHIEEEQEFGFFTGKGP